MLVQGTAAKVAQKRAQDGFESLRADADGGRQAHAWRTLDERGAAEQMVRDQYTGRYPLELLQNANDAAASHGATGRRVRFELTATALLIADEGAGFGPDQVRAICGLARSSKDPRKSIGHKGLGFKSVREITDRPQIISTDVAIGFDVERLRRDVETILGPSPHVDQRLPDYAFPYLLAEADLGPDTAVVSELRQAGFRTIFRLPFREGVSRRAVAGHVCTSLDRRVLLFLDALDRIEVVGTDRDFVAKIDRTADPDEPAAVRLFTESTSEQFLVYARTVGIPDPGLVADLGRGWSEVDQVRMAVAVPLDVDGRPAREVVESVRVYFPTEETPGLPLLLNADFQTELDRRRISGTAEHRRYNTWLCSELAAFVTTEVAQRLLLAFPGDPAASACLVPGQAAGQWGSTLRDELVNRLRTEPVFLRRDGSARSARELCLLPRSVPGSEFVYALLPDVESLVHRELNASDRLSAFLHSELRVPEVPGLTVARSLRPQSSTDPTAFFEFLGTWERSAGSVMRTWLREATCVRLLDGAWVTPASGPFFPRQRGEIDFPPELHLPIVDLEGVSDVARLLLEQAGVQRFEWSALVPRFLIPLLERTETSSSVRDAALRALRQYFEADGANVEIQKVVGRVRVPVTRSDGTGETLVPAGQAYFGDAWDESIETTAIYGPFGRPEFLAVTIPDDLAEREADLWFFSWLGVDRLPRLVPISDGGEDGGHSGITQRAIREWRSSTDFRRAASCGQGHSQSQSLKSSFHIDRLTDLVATQDKERLAALWRALGAGWSARYSATLRATFHCRANAHVGARDRELPSLLWTVLRDSAWVPMDDDAPRALAKPCDLWDPGKARPSVYSRVAGLPVNLRRAAPSAMLADLGVLDAGRIDATRLVSFLQQLQAEAETAGEVADDLADAARWATGRLDRCVADGEDLEGPVPLLATSRGELTLAPEVVLCHDVSLAAAWDDAVALFVPDDAWTSLPAALGLRDLASQIVTAAELSDRDTDREHTLFAAFNETLPELLALAADRARERETELAGLLRRITIRAGRRLELIDTFRGETRSRGNSAAYLSLGGDNAIAYLQIDEDGTHDPFAFGRELAAYLNRPQLADALGILLDGQAEVRQRYLRSRKLDQDSVARASDLIDATKAPTPEPEGELDTPTEGADEPSSSPGTPRPSPTTPTPGPPARPETASAGSVPPPAADARDQRGGGVVSPPSVPGPRDYPPGDAWDDAPDPESSNPPRRTSGGSRMGTYVGSGGAESSGGMFGASSHREAVDRAGVAAALAYERAQGRYPEEQDHDQPGFDILSYDDDENVVRVIEVKSTNGPWGARGVAMSAPQMARNRTDGDRFWLYVVEHALDDDRRVLHRVQNPAALITDYAFDDGWRAVAERVVID